MSDVDAKKMQKLESDVKRLERLVSQLTQRVNYLERERQRIKSDVGQIAGYINRRQ